MDIGLPLCRSREELHNQVLREFITQIDFTGLLFDEALRCLLVTFRLPGEAQKIDRVMSEFARRYCTNNPTVFSSPDTAYVLAYSLIMLNTDAHNPNVKRKMSLLDFLRNNRGIDDKKDLSEDFMRQLYFNIVNHEIKMDNCDNMYKTRELLGQVSNLPDKIETFVSPQRRLVREFNTQQVPDLFKPNAHRHERTVFLFNDVLMVTKPRVPFSATAGSPSQTMTGAMSPGQDRWQYRYQFNFVSMRVTDLSNTAHHLNVVELTNPNGRLITLSFPVLDDKYKFIELLSECIEEVADAEEQKRIKLQQLVEARVATAKSVIEEAYGNLDAGSPTPAEVSASRFKKYGSLRDARLALQNQTTMLFGKNKLKAAAAKASAATSGAVVGGGGKVTDFHTVVRLVTPSPSPMQSSAASATAAASDTLTKNTRIESTQLQTTHHDPSEGDEEPVDIDKIVTRRPLTPVTSPKSGTSPTSAVKTAIPGTPESLPNKLRKRRHTLSAAK